MKKKLLSVALIASLVLSAAGCGETGSSDEINLDNIEEKIDNMSDDEIEQAVLDGIEKLEEEYGNGAAITEAATTTAEPEPEEIVYEPAQEILDADFSSMKIQINNDVFQQGGYITVAELVEQYGNRYEFTYKDGTYEERKDYLLEYRFNGGTKWLSDSIEMTPLYGNNTYGITAYVANLSSPDEKITLDKAHVVLFSEKVNNLSIYTPVWTPKGFFGIIDFGMDNNKKEEFDSQNGSYKFSDFSAFLEAEGFSRPEGELWMLDYSEWNMKYESDEEYNSSYTIYFSGETNASGYKPLFKCWFVFDKNTDKVDFVKYELIDFFE